MMIATYPPWVAATDSICMFWRQRLEEQFPPPVVLKYAHMHRGTPVYNIVTQLFGGVICGRGMYDGWVG
jgi:hypothetical protein